MKIWKALPDYSCHPLIEQELLFINGEIEPHLTCTLEKKMNLFVICRTKADTENAFTVFSI